MKSLQYILATDTYEIQDLPIPEPGPDEVRVKCLATALNPVDAKVGRWKGMLDSGLESICGGLDVCGIVDAVGSDVTTLHVGDKVLYHGFMKKPHGGFAEYALHDALTCVVVNDVNVDAVTLAATPCAAWTAYRALYDKLLMASSMSISIVGASGGVGTFALQFAKRSGLKRIIAVCSSKNESYVRSLGASDVVCYDIEKSIHDGIQRVTNGEGVDLILDCVGSETCKDAIRSLKFDGKICPAVSFAEGDLEGFMKCFSYCQISLGGAHTAGLAARQHLVEVGRIVTSLVHSKEIQVPVTKVIGLDDVAETLKEMLSANNTGKIVLKL